MTFGPVVFLPRAKEIEQVNIIKLSHSKEDVIRASEERIKALEQHHQEDLRQLQSTCDLKEKKILSQKEQLSKKVNAL
jgi:hypothetical protein